jgi:hypothetical protein
VETAWEQWMAWVPIEKWEEELAHCNQQWLVSDLIKG